MINSTCINVSKFGSFSLYYAHKQRQTTRLLVFNSTVEMSNETTYFKNFSQSILIVAVAFMLNDLIKSSRQGVLDLESFVGQSNDVASRAGGSLAFVLRSRYGVNTSDDVSRFWKRALCVFQNVRGSIGAGGPSSLS